MDEMHRIQDSAASLEQHLMRAVEFLGQYCWIYDAKNVDLFVSDVLQKIPTEWVQMLPSLTMDDLRKMPFNFTKEEWPLSFKEFLKNANALAKFRYNRLQQVNSIQRIEVPDFVKKSTPSKKLNEIVWMTAAVENVLETHSCNVILDIGSGLGYLDQILHHNLGVTTIGFEIVKERSLRAGRRLQRGHCSQNMHYVNSKIEDTKECAELIKAKLNEISDEVECSCGRLKKLTTDKRKTKVLMIGLHSCGSLMQDMMKLFVKIPEVELFFCVGCCYHFVPLSEFPLSNVSKRVLHLAKDKLQGWAPSTTGLRLGCQYGRAYWQKLSDEEHCLQEKCLIYRAVLQKFIIKENLMWCKPKRHLRRQSAAASFEKFVSFAFQNCCLSELEKEQQLEQLHKLYRENEKNFPLIKLLNLLQTLLQPVWEGFIIADRQSYFLENSIKAEISLLCDELISPRNVILFGIK